MSQTRETVHLDFILRIEPTGHRPFMALTPQALWFRTESPLTWGQARDLLVAGGVVDSALAGQITMAGGWALTGSPAPADLLRLSRSGKQPLSFPSVSVQHASNRAASVPPLATTTFVPEEAL